MNTTTLSIDLLVIDADTQSRVAISEDTVEDYAEVIEKSGKKWPFEPLDVFHDGSDHFVADGFHRTLGAQRTKRASIPCRIHKGTARDARIFAMTANDTNGLRMTREDKRSCVEWLLDNEKMTQAKIAETAGVSKRTVTVIAAERKAQSASCSEGVADGAPGKKGASGSDKEAKQDTPAELAKKNKKLVIDLLARAARTLGDLHEVKPNRRQRDRCVKAVQRIMEEVW